MGGRFEGNIVIVTGAAEGLGQAIVKAFLAEGASVALADADAAQLDETVRGLHEVAPARVIPVQTDVTNELSVQRMVQATVDMYKRVDVLVCSASVHRTGLVTEFDATDWRRVLEVNLIGTFLCMKHAARLMKEQGGGAIVQVNSIAARAGGAGDSALAASMAGSLGLMRALALEMAPSAVRVNAVCSGDLPGVPLGGMRPGNEPMGGSIDAFIPLRRMGQFADIVSAVSFLASHEAGYITGQALNVDGGQVMA